MTENQLHHVDVRGEFSSTVATDLTGDGNNAGVDVEIEVDNESYVQFIYPESKDINSIFIVQKDGTIVADHANIDIEIDSNHNGLVNPASYKCTITWRDMYGMLPAACSGTGSVLRLRVRPKEGFKRFRMTTVKTYNLAPFRPDRWVVSVQSGTLNSGLLNDFIFETPSNNDNLDKKIVVDVINKSGSFEWANYDTGTDITENVTDFIYFSPINSYVDTFGKITLN